MYLLSFIDQLVGWTNIVSMRFKLFLEILFCRIIIFLLADQIAVSSAVNVANRVLLGLGMSALKILYTGQVYYFRME